METLSGLTSDTLAMSWFNDESNMREPLRRFAEQIVNAVMDAEADSLRIECFTNLLDTTFYFARL